MNGITRGTGRLMVTLLAVLATAGCYEHTMSVGGGAPNAPVVYDHWENFWLGGLVGHVKVDVQQMCPSGRATIESKQTFLNGLVTALTSSMRLGPEPASARRHDHHHGDHPAHVRLQRGRQRRGVPLHAA